MTLRAALSFSLLQTVVSVICSFVSVKITSVLIGPVGLGLVGIMTYLISLAQNPVANGLQIGFVRRAATQDPLSPRRAVIGSTVFRIMVCLALPMSCGLLLFSTVLSTTVFHDPSLAGPVMVFGAIYVFGLLAVLAMGAAVSMKDVRSVAAINIGNAVMTPVMFAVLCPQFGVRGGLMAVAVMPLVGFLVSWFIVGRKPWWPARPWAHGFSAEEAKAVVALIPPHAINAIGMPLIQILVRNALAAHSDATAVGLLQGIVRLSDTYLAMITTLLGTYFLPRFVEIRKATELQRELLRGLAVIVPAVAAMSLLIYLLRDPILHVVFTAEFLPMRDLFAWQMVGNTLRTAGWVFGYLLLAKAHPAALAVFEVSIALLWWLLSLVLIPQNGAVGATQAYAGTYAVYLVVGVVGGLWVLRLVRRKEV